NGALLRSLFADANGIGLGGIAGCTDINVFTAGGKITASIAADRNVVIAGRVSFQRLETLPRIVVTGCVIFQRQKTASCVVRASSIAKKRFGAISRVLIAACVLKKRNNPCGCIGGAACVVGERLFADCGVVTGRAVSERLKTSSRVVAGAHAGVERGRAYRRIAVPSRVAKQGTKTDGGVVSATAEFQESRITLSSVVIRIASVRRWGDRESDRG